MDKLYNIIRNNRMSTRPEYYSGRGATISDLDGNILEGIYRGIETDYGKNAAKNFLKMVEDIKVMSATTFLEELYQLFRNDWKYKNKSKHASGITVPKDENGEYDIMAGMFGMMAALTSNGRDDTQRIKGSFLRSHGVKAKEVSRDMYGDVREYYY
jgi:hypothetical protein